MHRKKSSELLELMKGMNESYQCACVRVYGVLERLYRTVFYNLFLNIKNMKACERVKEKPVFTQTLHIK
jgi:hypothetical protein